MASSVPAPVSAKTWSIAACCAGLGTRFPYPRANAARRTALPRESRPRNLRSPSMIDSESASRSCAVSGGRAFAGRTDLFPGNVALADALIALDRPAPRAATPDAPAPGRRAGALPAEGEPEPDDALRGRRQTSRSRTVAEKRTTMNDRRAMAGPFPVGCPLTPASTVPRRHRLR